MAALNRAITWVCPYNMMSILIVTQAWLAPAGFDHSFFPDRHDYQWFHFSSHGQYSSHSLIIKGADYHRFEIEGNRLQRDILSGNAGFHVNITYSTFSIFSRRSGKYRAEND